VKANHPGAKIMNTTANMKSIVTEVLTQCGWSAFGGPALALKSFETAVGEKQAAVHLSAGDEFNRTLSGTYESEGRNALSASSILIPVNADQDTVRRLAAKFAKQVDDDVAQTYAVRLLQPS
jgi:hypothetical protein